MTKYKIVPTTITQEMVDEMCYDTTADMMQRDWKACLDAAPKASEDEELVERVALMLARWDLAYMPVTHINKSRAVLRMLEGDDQ